MKNVFAEPKQRSGEMTVRLHPVMDLNAEEIARLLVYFMTKEVRHNWRAVNPYRFKDWVRSVLAENGRRWLREIHAPEVSALQDTDALTLMHAWFPEMDLPDIPDHRGKVAASA